MFVSVVFFLSVPLAAAIVIAAFALVPAGTARGRTRCPDDLSVSLPPRYDRGG